MTGWYVSNLRGGPGTVGLVLWLFLMAAPGCAAVEPTPAAVSGFSAYIRGVESRLEGQHRLQSEFLAPAAGDPGGVMRLRNGELIVEKVTSPTGSDFEGAMLHHWRGTAFVPGATVADFERLMKDFDSYPQRFAPQVLRARVLAEDGGDLRAVMRVRQQHIITVVMDTAYDIRFARLDGQHGYSISRSTKIDEVEGTATKSERVLNGAEEHGFLWQLNTYWSYEERDGGLYMQIEAVSLTRAVPHGLGWVVGPFVESVPRESLEFTLRAVQEALRK